MVSTGVAKADPESPSAGGWAVGALVWWRGDRDVMRTKIEHPPARVKRNISANQKIISPKVAIRETAPLNAC
jgi:hypothetical protein